jgi:hypothetical protein
MMPVRPDFPAVTKGASLTVTCFDPPVGVETPEGFGLIHSAEEGLDWVEELLAGDYPPAVARALRHAEKRLRLAVGSQSPAVVGAARVTLQDSVRRLSLARR